MIFNGMGLFREGYSREGFEEKSRLARGAYETARFRGTITGLSERAAQKIYDDLWEASGKADRALEKMLAAGQKEATELNHEYDRLRQNVVEAVNALQTFEREKLGMKDEKEEEEVAVQES